MKHSQKAKILDFFIMACQGIRQEYEQGASYRSLSEDLQTLEQLLKEE